MPLTHFSVDAVPCIREIKKDELIKIFVDKNFSSEKVNYTLSFLFDTKFTN